MPARPLKPLSDCRLYAFVDSAYLHGRDPAAICTDHCRGGADLIQLRAKDWPETRVESEGRRLLPVCAAHGVRLVINDHPEVEVRIGAPTLHLGQEDFFDAGLRLAREICPPESNLELGLSTHAPDQARRAVDAGPAYVAIGPIFPTATKPGRPAVTLDYVRWAARELSRIPWFAIGGIHPGNLDLVLDAGATRICVVSAILNAPDIAEACRAFRDRLPK